MEARAAARRAAGRVAAPRSSSASKTPITIGASLSLSGDFSADGQAFDKGYQLWATDQNAAGGLIGRPVKLDIISDASSPAQVVTNYTKLISSDHDQLVFGPFSTLLTVPSSKVVNRYGYAFVEGAGGAPAVFGNGLNNIFDVSLPVIDNLVPFAHWVAVLPASERPTTAAIATSNDPFTQPQLPAAQKILQAAGIKTVYNKAFPAEVTDYTPIAPASRAPRPRRSCSARSTCRPCRRSSTPSSSSTTTRRRSSRPPAPTRERRSSARSAGRPTPKESWSRTAGIPGIPNADSQKMVSEYVAKYGGSPSDVNADVAEAYSVGQIVAQAVNATHSLDNRRSSPTCTAG